MPIITKFVSSEPFTSTYEEKGDPMKLFSTLYLLGSVVAFSGFITITMSIISDGANGQAILFSIFAILNGVIAIGVAEILKIVSSK